MKWTAQATKALAAATKTVAIITFTINWGQIVWTWTNAMANFVHYLHISKFCCCFLFLLFFFKNHIRIHWNDRSIDLHVSHIPLVLMCEGGRESNKSNNIYLGNRTIFLFPLWNPSCIRLSVFFLVRLLHIRKAERERNKTNKNVLKIDKIMAKGVTITIHDWIQKKQRQITLIRGHLL